MDVSSFAKAWVSIGPFAAVADLAVMARPARIGAAGLSAAVSCVAGLAPMLTARPFALPIAFAAAISRFARAFTGAFFVTAVATRLPAFAQACALAGEQFETARCRCDVRFLRAGRSDCAGPDYKSCDKEHGRGMKYFLDHGVPLKAFADSDGVWLGGAGLGKVAAATFDVSLCWCVLFPLVLLIVFRD